MNTAAVPIQEAFAGRTHEILTPEGIGLRFAIARAGDRLGAFLLDATIILIATILIVVAAATASMGGVDESGWLWAFVFVAVFLLHSFYFIWFESRGRGTTPGKVRMGIRIMDAQGGTLTVGAIVVRNVMRILEVHIPLIAVLAPEVFWASAPVWAQLIAAAWLLILAGMPLFNPRRMRVGDFVAGTVVVTSPAVRLERDVGAESAASTRAAAATPEDSAYAFTREQLDVYGNYELQVLEDVLRQRRGVSRSDDVLAAVADRIARKLDWPRRLRRSESRAFLQAFYVALRGRLEQRMLFGKRKADKHSD
jgi:uncharacterized RDD family membrane protein YckC